MSVAVRAASEDDAQALIDLRYKLFRETDFMLYEPDEFTQTAEDERNRIARLNTRANCLVVAAMDGTEAVGILSAIGGEVRRLRHSATLALGVAQSHWGQGVATQMIQHALAWSSTAGLRRLELTVHTSNLRAVSVYLRAGFEVEGVRRSSLFVGGRHVNEYLMSRISEA
jgi:RimJ/RimL family protein N-acetyltransferase